MQFVQNAHNPLCKSMQQQLASRGIQTTHQLARYKPNISTKLPVVQAATNILRLNWTESRPNFRKSGKRYRRKRRLTVSKRLKRVFLKQKTWPARGPSIRLIYSRFGQGTLPKWQECGAILQSRQELDSNHECKYRAQDLSPSPRIINIGIIF